jgi:hypothetical protein
VRLKFSCYEGVEESPNIYPTLLGPSLLIDEALEDSRTAFLEDVFC